ncbi:hypothetical protein [Bacillus cereus]|nr:hypothetical protein [Bacillus cereus]
MGNKNNMKVGISLGEKVLAEPIIEHIANLIIGRVIKGREINEIR